VNPISLAGSVATLLPNMKAGVMAGSREHQTRNCGSYYEVKNGSRLLPSCLLALLRK
jgi:hypothetical protein